jgi:uncharacterized damage-inducible protein DinB
MAAIDALLQELEQEAATTRKVLARVPGDKLDWRPHPRSMSLGELAMHIATVPGNVAQMATLDTFEMPQFRQPAASNVAELMPALDETLTKARAALGGMSDATLFGMWRMVAGGRQIMAMPRAAVLRTIMLNHWYHHRGQLSVYLRELNVPVPAIYGPSADENPFMN